MAWYSRQWRMLTERNPAHGIASTTPAAPFSAAPHQTARITAAPLQVAVRQRAERRSAKARRVREQQESDDRWYREPPHVARRTDEIVERRAHLALDIP